MIRFPLQRRAGFCLVISAPSGTGKTSISHALLASDSTLLRSMSTTTRPKRPGEIEGQDYHFTTVEEFRRIIDRDEFLEWAEVHGDSYGTPRGPIERAVRDGQVILLIIDVQGARAVKAIYPDAVLVFLVPPSLESLEQRLRGRGTETESAIQSRLAEAMHEIQQMTEYTYLVINEDGQQQRTVETLRAIIAAERSRISRWEGA